jgi:hypothetical protein
LLKNVFLTFNQGQQLLVNLLGQWMVQAKGKAQQTVNRSTTNHFSWQFKTQEKMDQQLKIFDPKMISFSGNQLLQPSTDHKTDHFLGFCMTN